MQPLPAGSSQSCWGDEARNQDWAEGQHQTKLRPPSARVVLAALGPPSPFLPPLLVRPGFHLSRLPHLQRAVPLSRPGLSALRLALVPARSRLQREGKVWSSSRLHHVGREESGTAPGGAKLPAWKASEDGASPPRPLCLPEAPPRAACPASAPCPPLEIPGSRSAIGTSLMRSPRWKLRRLPSSVM